MSYSFRIRLNRCPQYTLKADSEIHIQVSDKNSLIFKPSSSETISISEAKKWVLIGEHYSTEEEALEAGKHYLNVLTFAFAKMKLGVDFGDRTPKGGFFSHGLKMLEEKNKTRVLNDTHGLMVYVSEPPPMFASMKMEPLLGKDPKRLEKEFIDANNSIKNFTEQERLAFSLFNISYFQPTADSKFLLLVMSIEALIKPSLRSKEANNHIQEFIEKINNSNLNAPEKQSISGTLNFLKNESINQAGQKLVLNRLGTKMYNDKPAPQFFSYIYSLRSNLVHGNMPYPTFDEIANIVSHVEIFVSDLLTTQIPKEEK